MSPIKYDKVRVETVRVVESLKLNLNLSKLNIRTAEGHFAESISTQ